MKFTLADPETPSAAHLTGCASSVTFLSSSTSARLAGTHTSRALQCADIRTDGELQGTSKCSLVSSRQCVLCPSELLLPPMHRDIKADTCREVTHMRLCLTAVFSYALTVHAPATQSGVVGGQRQGDVVGSVVHCTAPPAAQNACTPKGTLRDGYGLYF